MLPAHKIVCLAGASDEAGRAIAQAFAQDGAHLALLGTDEASLTELASQLRERGTRVETAVVPNVQTEEEMHAAMSAVLAPFDNQLDILVSNPPLVDPGSVPFREVSARHISEVFENRSFWHIWVCQAALSRMGDGAAIVCVEVKQERDWLEQTPFQTQTQAALILLLSELTHEKRKAAIDINALIVEKTPESWFYDLEPSLFRDEAARWKHEASQRAAVVLFLAQGLCNGFVFTLHDGRVHFIHPSEGHIHFSHRTRRAVRGNTW